MPQMKLRIETKFQIAVILAFLSMSSVAAGVSNSGCIQRVECAIIRNVHDGDTLTCVSSADHGSFVVRFAGIDAP